MKIGYNSSSMQAYNAMLKTDRNMFAASAKLSLGAEISSASQDAAGLAISNNLRAQAEGIYKASQNASNAISMLQVIDASLNEMHSITQRIRELTVQASNDTYLEEERDSMQLEVQELIAELDSMSDRCEYNQVKLLKGGEFNFSGKNTISFKFQVGTNKGVNLQFSLPKVDSSELGLVLGDITYNPNAFDIVKAPMQATDKTDTAINSLSELRSVVGASINRLEHSVAYLDASYNASMSALSRIADTDMASEMSNYARMQVLTQTAVSVLAQANQTPQSVLQLLQ